jgi:hypothetical protein
VITTSFTSPKQILLRLTKDNSAKISAQKANHCKEVSVFPIHKNNLSQDFYIVSQYMLERV